MTTIQPLEKLRSAISQYAAREQFLYIEKAMRSGDLSREDLCRLIYDDHNLIDVFVVKNLLKSNLLSHEQFIEACGIDPEYMELLDQPSPKDPADDTDSTFRLLETIGPGTTEVYFWGIPGSGKTCALGAVMSIAKNGGDVMLHDKCQGAHYMEKLCEVFHRDGIYTFLPSGTSVDHTYEMRFRLIREDHEHPLTLIDMSGELFTCLYKKANDIPLDNKEEVAYDNLHNLLIEHPQDNRKLHFFVIEYGAGNKIYNQIRQDVYLQRAAEELERLDVFTRYTDAIYILLTKSDKAEAFNSANKEEEENHFKNYMSQHYGGFYRALKTICRKHEINNKELKFVPFSIGDVCFKKFCRFDSSSAREILDQILDNSFYYDISIIGKLKKLLGN